MIRNKIIKKLAIAFALTGIFSFNGVYSTTYTAYAAEQSASFHIDSITGDYSIINPTNYHLDCKNQGTVEKPIHLWTNVSGNSQDLTYKYTVSYKAAPGAVETYGPYKDNSFTWTPKLGGLVCITVTCTDKNGAKQSENLGLDINNKLVINSFTGDYTNGDFEVNGKIKLGETVKLKASVSGGYRYGNKNYSYRVIPRNASQYNSAVTYNSQSPNFNWTPKYTGIYRILLTVTDDIGNSAQKDYYIMVQ